MTHTQGKWAVVKTTGTDIKCGDTYVAGVHNQNKRIENIDEPYSLEYDTSETDANANLIASAPEMLKALKKCVNFYFEGISDFQDEVYALIAKAEGK